MMSLKPKIHQKYVLGGQSCDGNVMDDATIKETSKDEDWMKVATSNDEDWMLVGKFFQC